MKEQNMALVQTLYDAFGRGDVETILAHLADNVEWRVEGPAAIPYAGARRGTKEVARFFEAIGNADDNPKLQMDEYMADGDTVAVLGRYRATAKKTGKRIDTAVAHVFTIQAGKVTRFLEFMDTAHVADAHTARAGAAG